MDDKYEAGEGDLPPSLRNYIQRSFAMHTQVHGIEEQDVRNMLNELIRDAANKSQIHEIQWDNFPLPQDIIQSQRPFSLGVVPTEQSLNGDMSGNRKEPPSTDLHPWAQNHLNIIARQKPANLRTTLRLERCKVCGLQPKCPSDFKKHMLKHEKPFKCTFPGCKKKGGFTTVNDLKRHERSVHKIGVTEFAYRCVSVQCKNRHKIWPRLDNFKQHVHRMHPDEDFDDFSKRSIWNGRMSRSPTPGAISLVAPMETTLAGISDHEPKTGETTMSLADPGYRNVEGTQSQLDDGKIIQTMASVAEALPAGSGYSGNEACQLHVDDRIMFPSVVLPAEAPLADSGYHSGKGTGASSVCSYRSTGTSLDLPKDFLQEFVSIFAGALIDRSGIKAWASQAFIYRQPEEIDQRVNGLLKEYAISLARTNSAASNQSMSRIVQDASALVRRCRSQISRYFRVNALFRIEDTEDFMSRLDALGQQYSLSERLGLLTKESSTSIREPKDGADAHGENDDDDEDDDDDDDDIHVDDSFLDIANSLLFSGPQFQGLITGVRRALLLDDLQQLKEIEHIVSTTLDTNPGIYRTLFNVDWGRILNSLDSQFSGRTPNLGKIVVITGSALYAHATTCSEYLKKTWPLNPDILLSTLQDSLMKRKMKISIKLEDLNPSERNIVAKIHDSGTLQIMVQDGLKTIIDLAQQLSWITSALAQSPFPEEKVVSCRPNLSFQGSTHQFQCPRFLIEVQFETLDRHIEQACWLPLFSNKSISYGFPIPERESELGLEMSIELMAALAGVRHAMEYQGGIVMKGFSTALVPVKRQGDRVQWHLILGKDPEESFKYADAISLCGDRIMSDQLSLDALSSNRNFLGWCSVAETTLGAEDLDYTNIDYSGASDDSFNTECTGVSVGFQQFGLAQSNFEFGSGDGTFHFQRTGPYRRIISLAEKTPVLLYDLYEKRAWLVAASDVLLHVARHRERLGLWAASGGIKLDTSTSASKTLLQNSLLELSDDEDSWKFKDMVTSVWSMMEGLVGKKVSHDSRPGKKLHTTLQEILLGYEFKAIVEEKSTIRRKKCTLAKTNGGWLPLVQDIDALVLFANGFGDIIVPSAAHEGLCQSWKTVPKWKDYLATTVTMIEDLYNTSGCRVSREFLTCTGLRWHRGKSLLFEPCCKPTVHCCLCNRLQRIVPRISLGKTVAPGPLEEKGAVIFGASGNLLDQFEYIKKQKQRTLYSQPNISLGLADDRQSSDEAESDVISEPSSSVDLDSSKSTLTYPISSSNANIFEVNHVALQKRRIQDLDNTYQLESCGTPASLPIYGKRARFCGGQ